MTKPVMPVDLDAKLKRLRETFDLSRNEKPPRAHAADVLKLRTKEERRAAIDKLPADIQPVVKFYVADFFARRHNKTPPDLAQFAPRPEKPA